MNPPLPGVNVMNGPAWKLCCRSSEVSRTHLRRFEVRPIAKHRDFRDNSKRTKRNVEEANLDVSENHSPMASPVEYPASSSSSIDEANCPMIEAALPKKRRSSVIDLRSPRQLPKKTTQIVSICSSDDEIEILNGKPSNWAAKPPRRRQKLTHPTLAEKLRSSPRKISLSKMKSSALPIQPRLSPILNEYGEYILNPYALKQIQTKAPAMPRLENPEMTC